MILQRAMRASVIQCSQRKKCLCEFGLEGEIRHHFCIKRAEFTVCFLTADFVTKDMSERAVKVLRDNPAIPNLMTVFDLDWGWGRWGGK